jgi:hypothetical protein
MATRATINHPDSTGRDGAIDHMVKWLDGAPPGSASRKLHTGPSGETWYLVNDMTGPSIVHVPVGTGGRAERLTVGAFLCAGDGPEQRELLRRIATLVDHD